MAIKAGHLLRYEFPDGIFWYRLDNSKLQDIFIAIAHLLNEELPDSKDLEIIASFIRSILARKKVLLILDNVEKEDNIHHLLPHNETSCIMILSRQKDLYLPTKILKVSLESFTEDETSLLFEHMLSKAYVTKHQAELLELSNIVGSLPLAIHLLTSQLKQQKTLPHTMLEQAKKELISLHNLSYENKNLYLALNISYNNLSSQAKRVLLSLGIFEGKDFSFEAIAYTNSLTQEHSKNILQELNNASLIESSLNNKYRMHPMIKKFISEKLNSSSLPLLIKVTFVMFSLFTVYWIFVNLSTTQPFIIRRFFGATYFILAVWGGYWGFLISQKWGGFSSIIGRVLLMFSLGFYCQVFGQLAYAFYISYLHINIPYPSLGDLGYFVSMWCYIYGTLLLAKAYGIKINKQLFKKHSKVTALLIAILASGYLLLLREYVFDWHNPLKIFFDFAYPLGDMIYVSLSVIVYTHLAKMKKMIIVPFSLFCLCLSDFVFVYQANAHTWQTSQINDYMYCVSYLLLTLAILRLNSDFSKVVSN